MIESPKYRSCADTVRQLLGIVPKKVEAEELKKQDFLQPSGRALPPSPRHINLVALPNQGITNLTPILETAAETPPLRRPGVQAR